MKILTEDLIGPELNWFVHGLELKRDRHCKTWVKENHEKDGCHSDYCGDWTWGGPVIKRDGLAIVLANKPENPEEPWVSGLSTGATPLVAAMRCYVWRNLGSTVELPDHLKTNWEHEQIRAERELRVGPQLGDYVSLGGGLERICVLNKDTKTIQTTLGSSGDWVLGRKGFVSFSGTCVNLARSAQFDVIPISTLRLLDYKQAGYFSVEQNTLKVDCNVYEIA